MQSRCGDMVPYCAYLRSRIGTLVLLIDLDESATITNRAQEIVIRLRAEGFLKPGDRLVYRDTNGNWDEILHGEQFDFRHLGVGGLQKALAEVSAQDATELRLNFTKAIILFG